MLILRWFSVLSGRHPNEDKTTNQDRIIDYHHFSNFIDSQRPGEGNCSDEEESGTATRIPHKRPAMPGIAMPIPAKAVARPHA
jgi:hypothetical protein